MLKKSIFAGLFVLQAWFLTASFALSQNAEPTCPSCPDWLSYDASSLEEALQRPEEIHSLDIAMQKLTSVDPRIAQLVNLECLDLSFNKFSTLPAEFAHLKNLKCLRLSGCRFLPGVPAVLANLPNLQYLDLRDHPEWGQKQYDEAAALLPNCTIVR